MEGSGPKRNCVPVCRSPPLRMRRRTWCRSWLTNPTCTCVQESASEKEKKDLVQELAN
jgi:hypothetical protein